jgi:hypothetical protein
MKVSNLQVVIEHSDNNHKDITDLILNININESLYGDLSGHIEVVDGVAALDHYINSQSKVSIMFKYLNQTTKHMFVIDGIESIDISSNIHKKTYVINLKSVNTFINSMNLISKSFKGKSTDIIKKIHDEFFTHDLLNIFNDSATIGTYISPNCSPKDAIDQILDQAYDSNNSPFFLFQRLIDEGQSILESLDHIKAQEPFFEISPVIINKEKDLKPLSIIGQPENIIIHSDNIDTVHKISTGVFGKNIKQLDISNSGIIDDTYGIQIKSTSTLNPFRPDMYTNDVKPLLNSGDLINVTRMNTILNLMDTQMVTAYHCVAIPGLSVGHIINLNISSNSIGSASSSIKFAGAYVVSDINHRLDDGHYTQTIELSRG